MDTKLIQENCTSILSKLKVLEEMVNKQEHSPVRLAEPMARLFLGEIAELTNEIQSEVPKDSSAFYINV